MSGLLSSPFLEKLRGHQFEPDPVTVWFHYEGEVTTVERLVQARYSTLFSSHHGPVPPLQLALHGGIGTIKLDLKLVNQTLGKRLAEALGDALPLIRPLVAVAPATPPWTTEDYTVSVADLSGVPTLVELPFEIAKTSRPGHDCLFLPLSPAAAAALRKLSDRHAAMVTAVLVVIHRHTGQDDFLIAHEMKTTGMVFGLEQPAFFRFSHAQSQLAELLGAVKPKSQRYSGCDDWLGAVAELCDGYAHGRHPLMQVACTSINADLPKADATLYAALTDSHGGSDLLMTLFTGDGRPGLAVTFAPGVLPRAYIERVMDHTQAVICDLDLCPEKRLGELSLTSSIDLAQVQQWNTLPSPRPKNVSLVEVLRAHTAASPGRICLSASTGDRMTYGEVDRQSDRCADGLVAMGIRPGDVVALWFDRSISVAVAMWGILKAGATFLPLDLNYPQDRLQYIIGQAAANLIIHDEDIAWPLGDSLPVTTVSQLVAIAKPQLDAVKVPPGSPAYLIYTSGSTGRPKGITCTHAAVINLIDDFQRLCPLAATDVAACWSSFSFDAAIFEMFTAFVAGCALAIVPEEVRPHPANYFGWLQREKIAHAYIPPMFVKELAQSALKDAYFLKCIMVGVEPINESLLASIQARVPGLVIVNAYGPTESTVIATRYLVPPDGGLDRRTPIGVPVAHTHVYIVDRELRQQPIGVYGELLIGGIGLAWGYRGATDLTAERFVPDPFGGFGARLYRSGDIARWRDDGDIEFRGRQDFQVKIQGMRIECGEIEAALLALPGVSQAVVIVGLVGGNSKALIAYVVCLQGSTASSDELREGLLLRLPQFMIPSAFVFLKTLPKLPSGKVDRKHLPLVAIPQTALPVAARPDDAMLNSLVDTCKKAFELDRLEVTQNFFDVGVTSLGLAKLQALLLTDLGYQIKLVDLYRFTTVARLKTRLLQIRT